jgi:hypothetical protein
VSTMAAQTSPDVTWRDAVTPLGRASRRRWTACYALLLALLAASVADGTGTFAVWRSDKDTIPFVLIVALPVVFGMLRRGTLDEQDRGGLPEPVRDALLGLALAGAIVMSLVTDDDSGTLLFVAALALLGALARRAAGQPVMSRQRQWRVAIGIVLILLVVGLAFVLGGSHEGTSETIGPPQTQTP